MEISVVFASQTGTSQELGLYMTRKLAERGLEVSLMSIEQFELEMADFAVFLISTTGQGEPPESMKKFWFSLLQEDLPNDLLEDFQFTVFGLGSSSYVEFNSMARKLWVRLQQLGARSFYRRGLGDENHDFLYEGEFQPWFEGLIEVLDKGYGIREIESLYCVGDGQEERYQLPGTVVQVKENCRITSGETDIWMLKFDFSEDYSPGDVCVVYYNNSDDDVQSFMEMLELQDRIIEIKKNAAFPVRTQQILFPQFIRISNLVKYYLDIKRWVSRQFIELLEKYATEENEKEKLQQMTQYTDLGRSEFHRYISQERRNYLEVLWDFKSARGFQFEELLETIPPLKPREYSIASSPGEVRILYSILTHITAFKRQVPGQCTHFLMKQQDTIRVSLRKGNLPIFQGDAVMFACGSGISPFIPFIEYRNQRNLGNNYLFFGCRNPEQDDLTKILQVSCFIINAYSRTEQKYVQHKIPEHGQLLVDLLLNGSAFYICGKSKGMPTEIKSSLTYQLAKFQQWEVEQAGEFMEKFTKSEKWHVEAWG